MATCLYADGIRFPDGTCQRTQGVTQGGLFMCYNTCLVCCGPHRCRAHCGRCGTWTSPTCSSEITFEVWSGGGSGAGHCCFGCRCDIGTCAAFSGYYGKKTIRRQDGQFVPGCAYSFCVGAGGNGTSNNGCGCFTVCRDGPRGCMSWVSGSGLCCFCMTGGRGAYTIYCACRCNNHGNRVDGMCNNGLCLPCKFDFVSMGTQPFTSNRIANGCNCGGRVQRTSNSYGLTNMQGYDIGYNVKYCGCTSCCRGMEQIARGGMSVMKSSCGQDISHCRGTPGNPGMVRITWR
jgi:hypothetical protein